MCHMGSGVWEQGGKEENMHLRKKGEQVQLREGACPQPGLE